MTTPTMASRLDMDTWRQTVVRDTKRLKPTHLSLFVLGQNTGHPIARMPFYAEVGVTSFLPPAKPECKLKEVIRIGLREFSSSGGAYRYEVYTRAPVEPLVEPLCDALSRVLAQETIDRLAEDPTYAAPIISGVIQIASDIATGKNIDANDPDALRKLLEDAIHAYAKEHDLPLVGVHPQEQRIVWAHPLGVLATDHVGYLSFDLTRLPPDVANALALALEARRRDPNTPTDISIWLYPMAQEAEKIDALAQGRFAHDAIVVKLELDLEFYQPKLCDSVKNLGIMAMQNPSLTDWRLSPGSFATNPGALVGADGCEMALPSNIALHEFNFHQVIGVPTTEVGLPIDAAATGKVRPGFVNEFRLSFIPIGHALGQILYSFPLAPGESVNFAVIDWTRRDSALRNESTKLDESLVHELRRDRIITETVKASIDEWQHGGSIMGGLAGSAGGAMGASGMGAAAGASAAIGGAYSTTSGSRDIAADTVQKLSDNVAQAATSSRELHSTVVIQSSQAEHEAIETRTVVNYNHSHSLTILYYEVLRHFRVVTEFVRRRPALLTNIHGGIFEPGREIWHEVYWPVIYENRKLLEAALLDDRYKEAFDIVERRRRRERVAEVIGPLPTPKVPPDPPSPQGPAFRFFTFEIRTGDVVPTGDEDIHISANIDLNVAPWFIKLNNGNRISPAGTFYEKGHLYSFVAKTEPPEPRSISWGEIEAIAIFVHLNDWDTGHDMSFSFLRITGTDVNGLPTILYEKDYVPSDHLIFDNDITMFLPTRRPAPLPPPPGRSAESIEEEAKFKEFNEHLLIHRAHYERALRLGSTPAQRAFELASLGVGGGASLLEKVDNRPLEVLGDYVAYPCIDPVWSDKIMDVIKNQLPHIEPIEPVERLVTLPTRGVFAEAKLGHCNASEELDPTRFWKWEEHPIPHMASEIAPIQGVTPQPQQSNLSPTPFPQSLVNIVNPPAAPDPQGMTAALTALATANIFRDMSGRAEVADLLKKLSDNSVAIAGVAQKAATGGASGASGGSGGGGGVSQLPAGNVGTGIGQSVSSPIASADNQSAAPPQQTPEQRASQQIDNHQKVLQTARDYLSPDQQAQVRDGVTKDLTNISTGSVENSINFPYKLNLDDFTFKKANSVSQKTNCLYIEFGQVHLFPPDIQRREVGFRIWAPLVLGDKTKITPKMAQSDSYEAATKIAWKVIVDLQVGALDLIKVEKTFLDLLREELKEYKRNYTVNVCRRSTSAEAETGGTNDDIVNI
jgi:hypothetical protein